MKIRVNKAIGVIIIVFAAMDVCLFLVVGLSAGKLDFFLGLSSLVGIGLGILFLRSIYFEIDQNALVLRALVGSAHKTYTFITPKDISVDGKTIYVSLNGNRQKLPISAWMADKKDWDAFVGWVSAAGLPPQP